MREKVSILRSPIKLHEYHCLLQSAFASLSKFGSWFLLCCKSELPPMCFLLMKMFGTVRCCVISSSASWMALPSSEKECRSASYSHQQPFALNITYQLGRVQWHNTWRPCLRGGSLRPCSKGSTTLRKRLGKMSV